MTIDERARALDPLGLTLRQARFVTLVALQSGYCLRRQYAAFAGLSRGAVVRHFLDGLVARGWARPLRYRADRGLVYHLHGKTIYRLLGQADNRHRRRTSPAAIARKLMVLDFVLSQPDVTWYATEGEKVTFFAHQWGVPLRDLPQRVYRATRGTPTTTRYFVHKWPVFVAGAPARVHLVALVVEPLGEAFAQFLRDHARLLHHLPAWTMVLVSPAHARGVDACRSLVARFLAPSPPERLEDRRDVSRYFLTRKAVEAGEVGPVSIEDLNHYREAGQRLQGPMIEALYARWRRVGEAVWAGPPGPDEAAWAARGELRIHVLPFSYQQFGDLAGVC